MNPAYKRLVDKIHFNKRHSIMMLAIMGLKNLNLAKMITTIKFVFMELRE